LRERERHGDGALTARGAGLENGVRENIANLPAVRAGRNLTAETSLLAPERKEDLAHCIGLAEKPKAITDLEDQ